MKIVEGYMPFRGFYTYYRIVGENTENHIPILLLHGGPGSTHNYFEVLDILSESGRQVVMYDQIGCGNSYVEGHQDWWNEDIWIEELTHLIDYLKLDHVHLLGQSWGGMLAIAYISKYHPEKVKSVILSSTLPSSKLWASEQHRLIRYLTIEDQHAIMVAEKNNDYSGEAYERANTHYMERHCSLVDENTPECVTRKVEHKGVESYLYGWGPNEFTPLGTLKDFDYTEDLKNWEIPALIISGTDDLCTPLIAKTMYDLIPNCKWELFAGCRHMCFVENTKHYLEVVIPFLEENER